MLRRGVVITIDNIAELHISGDVNWTNWGSFDGDGPVSFIGSAAQQVSGGAIAFQNVNVMNNVNINSSCTIYQGLVVDDANLFSNGLITVNSDATSTGWIMPFVNGGNIIGDVIVERYIANNGFHYFGTPVNSPSITNQLSELNPNGPNGAQVIASVNCSTDSVNINSPYGSIFEYNQSNTYATSCGQEGWNVRSTGILTNGRGYAARINQGNTITINGDVNDGNLSYNGLINSGGFGNGYHLVSNAYPSPIQWNVVPGFNAAAYFWQTSGSYSGTYQAYFGSTGHQVASMQGFFVRTSTGPSSFALTNDDRISGDPAFFRTAAPLDNLIEIEVTGNGFADKSIVRFNDLATDQWDDNLDAYKLPGNSNQPIIYTRNGNDLLSVNSIRPVKEEKYVVLGFNPGENRGSVFDFEFTVKTANPPLVYLEDLLTGKSEQITNGYSYSFYAEHGQDDERFLLHFYPNGSEGSNRALIIYQGAHVIDISAPSDMTGSIVQVYDMLGQIVFSKQLSGNRIQIPNKHWTSGAYMIQVNGTINDIKKIVVE